MTSSNFHENKCQLKWFEALFSYLSFHYKTSYGRNLHFDAVDPLKTQTFTSSNAFQGDYKIKCR